MRNGAQCLLRLCVGRCGYWAPLPCWCLCSAVCIRILLRHATLWRIRTHSSIEHSGTNFAGADIERQTDRRCERRAADFVLGTRCSTQVYSDVFTHDKHVANTRGFFRLRFCRRMHSRYVYSRLMCALCALIIFRLFAAPRSAHC